MTSSTSTQSSTPKTSRRLVAAIVAGGVAIAGLTAAVTMTLETPSAHAQTTPSASSSASSAAHSSGSATHGGQHHSHHAVTPSQSTKTLQSQLAQLNYYEGPISGYWNSETTNAIDYLQASAHLPQTGTMNTATQAALDHQLVHGDNQMGG
jgi:peptidoglycan hydrolase-like protein with peptidoglycan-binding domain